VLHCIDVQEKDERREASDGGRVGYCEEWGCELFGARSGEELERESFGSSLARFLSHTFIEADLWYHISLSLP